jgi:hypothetical protein
LAAKDTSCNFKKDNIPCNGGPRIGRVTNYQTNIVSYFIGCNKYKQGDKWHRYIKVKQDEVDISLLQSLFTGSASVSIIYFSLLFFFVKLEIISNCK